MTLNDVYYKLGALESKTDTVRDEVVVTKRTVITTTLTVAGLILGLIYFTHTEANRRIDRVEARLSNEIAAVRELIESRTASMDAAPRTPTMQ